MNNPYHDIILKIQNTNLQIWNKLGLLNYSTEPYGWICFSTLTDDIDCNQAIIFDSQKLNLDTIQRIQDKLSDYTHEICIELLQPEIGYKQDLLENAEYKLDPGTAYLYHDLSTDTKFSKHYLNIPEKFRIRHAPSFSDPDFFLCFEEAYDNASEAYLRFYKNNKAAYPEQYYNFVLYSDDIPLACLSLLIENDVGLVCNAASRPHYRRHFPHTISYLMAHVIKTAKALNLNGLYGFTGKDSAIERYDRLFGYKSIVASQVWRKANFLKIK